MTDLLERLAAANPVPRADRPPIEELWRKLSELDAEPRRRRGARWGRFARRIVRAVPTAIAIAVPVAVVAAIAVPLLGTHHQISHPALTGPRRGHGHGHGPSTLNPSAQRVAAQQLAGRPGAVVVLDPRTGAIKVMYGNATHDEYSPGSAFEIVTAAAALDSGRYKADSLIAGNSPLTVSGVPIRNFANQSFGPITLSQALSYSVNTVFAQVGAGVGPEQMTASMRRLGFYSSPQLGSAADRVSPSGIRDAGRLVLPGTVGTSLGRLAIGQGGLAVTPLQMAMVASAVADRGTLMAPSLGTATPTVSVRAMKASTARTLATMLRQVVTHGTATSVNVRGLRIAGQTGTSDRGATRSLRSDIWFVGFAPADHPTIAIAVALKDAKGFGGTEAAPIAAKVIASLLVHDH
jgi:peptidoglycan glycosyltransferase